MTTDPCEKERTDFEAARQEWLSWTERASAPPTRDGGIRDGIPIKIWDEQLQKATEEAQEEANQRKAKMEEAEKALRQCLDLYRASPSKIQ